MHDLAQYNGIQDEKNGSRYKMVNKMNKIYWIPWIWCFKSSTDSNLASREFWALLIILHRVKPVFPWQELSVTPTAHVSYVHIALGAGQAVPPTGYTSHFSHNYCSDLISKVKSYASKALAKTLAANRRALKNRKPPLLILLVTGVFFLCIRRKHTSYSQCFVMSFAVIPGHLNYFNVGKCSGTEDFVFSHV